MLTWNKSLLSTIVACFILAIIAGCGGSSGGDSVVAESVYTGEESQALLDENNSRQIVEGAYWGGSSSSSLNVPFAAVNSVSLERNDFPLSWYLTTFAEDLVQHVNAYDGSGAPSAMSAVRQEPVEINDEDEGSILGTVTLDDETGDVSGTLTYNNYYLSGVVSNGVITFEGNVSGTGATIYIEFSFFTVSYDDVSRTMNGSVSLGPSNGNLIMILNIVITDNSTGKTYWMQDYRIEVEYDRDTQYVSVSGLFYDYDYGYVVLSTELPLLYYYNDNFPSSGIIKATGAQGSAGGNTWALLSALSSSTYYMLVDTDGNRYADWKTDTLYW
jgi:hypothetical protein